MGANQRNRQKNLERKRAKRKAAQNKRSQSQGSSVGFGFRSITAAINAPIHECWISTDIFEQGMGHAVISKRLPDGQIAFSSFLVDAYCLGVKDCFFIIKTEFEFNDFKSKSEARFEIENIHQTCLRKLVEGAVEYANSLGFRPHKEYKASKLIFGDIDPTLCPRAFEYGKDGQPFYIAGPNDSQSRQDTIMRQLQKSHGDDGYHYMVGGPPPETDDDVAQKNVKLVSFSITTDPIEDEYSRRIPEEIEERIEELYRMAWNEPRAAIPILLEMIEKYPDVVQFRNYLAMAYSGAGDNKKSKQIILDLHQDEPDYFFGKLNYAEYCISERNLEEFSTIFDGHYDLDSLYPDRDEFHLSEVMGFYSVICRYFLAKGEHDTANSYYKLMLDIDPDNRVTKHIGKLMTSKTGLFQRIAQRIISNGEKE